VNEYNYYGWPSGPPARSKPSYGCLKFLFDCFMVLLTSGLWIIWIFVREMRKR
jgi:hypothetical protein